MNTFLHDSGVVLGRGVTAMPTWEMCGISAYVGTGLKVMPEAYPKRMAETRVHELPGMCIFQENLSLVFLCT